MDTIEPQAKLFKALTHPARLHILEVLQDGEQCVCHLEAVLGYRQAYISQHLAVLRDVGLIEDRRDGWNVYYCVTRPRIYELLETASALTGEEIQKIAAAPPGKGKTCPCPKCNPAGAGAEKG